MTDLFTIPESKSPRLLWMERHELLTHYSKDDPDESKWMCIQPLPEDRGESIGECMARNCRVYEECNLIGYGSTEQEAIMAWAVKTKTKLWNEESASHQCNA